MIELPTLYARGHGKKMLQWRTWNESDVSVYEYGQVGGKLVQQRDRQAATNVGRSNARDGEAQAQFVCRSAWEHKLKEGYFQDMETAKTAEVLLPMLAQPLFKQTRNSKKQVIVKKADLFFPCHIQRKLNGLRCMAIVHEDRTVTLRSRQGTDWPTLNHIRAEVAAFAAPGDILDGEIYRDGVPLQVINGWIKNQSDPKAETARQTLQYHIYDIPKAAGINLIWENRLAVLHDRFRSWVNRQGHDWETALAWYNVGQYRREEEGQLVHPLALQPLTLVGTYQADTENQVEEFSKRVVMAGYEGAIVRHFGNPYLFDQRKSMVKVKLFTDEGFIVVDVIGRTWFKPNTTESTTIVDKYVCENNLDQQRFEVVPRGTMEQRAKMWLDREEVIGERLTVRFLERSVSGLPQGNPVGLGFRLPGDDVEEEEEMWS